MSITTYPLIITLNVNGLNAPIKIHRVAEWIRKQDLRICCLQETLFRSKGTKRLKVKEWKRYFMPRETNKKAGVAILISEKIDFKTKGIIRDKGSDIMIKGSTQQEDITPGNSCIQQRRTLIYKASLDGQRGGDWQYHSHGRGLYHPIAIKGQISQTEKQQGNHGVK